MNWTKRLTLLFFIFGCYAKFVPNVIGMLGYNAWKVIVIFWIVINAGGVLHHLLNPKYITKLARAQINEEMSSKWLAYNTIAAISYMMCNEWTMSLLFLMTSYLFMLIVLSHRKAQ